MPTLDVSELNVTIAIIGGFMVIQGLFSILIKSRLFLGEALPAMTIGIALGPIAANFLNNSRWGPGSLTDAEKSAITHGFMRVLISIQLLIAGYQLPARYPLSNMRAMFVVLIPVMTIMWLCTSACLMATIPKVSLLAAMAIGACVTSTDPVLSQAIAKGRFAEKYVARPLREIISAEAGANDGFGFPFLMLATYLMKRLEPERFHGGGDGDKSRGLDVPGAVTIAGALVRRLGEAGQKNPSLIDPTIGIVMENWGLETWLYTVVMSVPYGAVIGFGAGKAIKYCLRRKWIDEESYLLFPVALGLFVVGTCGCIGTDDLLASFCAGCALNWDGEYLAETEERDDEVNSSIDVLLNLTGFMYVGIIMPWSQFHDPHGTGITIWRLLGLGFMVLLFRRIPALLIMYKAMPSCVNNWKEAIFMGYFGPIGVGAVFYVEHAKPLFPPLGKADTMEDNLLRALVPCVYFLVFFSIVVHGLSIPALNAIYQYYDVAPVTDDAVQVRRKSKAIATPVNARPDDEDSDYFVAYNRFSRPGQGHRRTVALEGLPVSNNTMRESHNGNRRKEEREGERGDVIGRADTIAEIVEEGRMSWGIDSVEEEKVRAQSRAESLTKLG
ncbi:sodium/hydrogen exchanger family protein [Pseudomassariella vexata]|uniref:Sodium/hydrogen exchanger family protein n=1 Tax=Pseudomassariella vexata TaxID=1141098 RepID=A0A1Y2DMB6_9PEZI|nr:sodium/hydrogen exchanger family protein [Pseudomassariella vexata]ORY60289.1 sodium/hydrogen exchanger family protein [Pseudomassariella vexata]